MGLNYPAEWKFEGVGFSLPQAATSEFLGLLFKIDGGSQDVVEDFKAAFGASSWSSSYDWATSDLARTVESSAANAAAFVDSFWNCIERAQARGLPVPSVSFINKILAKHGVPLVLAGYVVEFVWLMQRYQACSRKDIETLLGTPAMEKLMANERTKLAALAGSLPESLMS